VSWRRKASQGGDDDEVSVRRNREANAIEKRVRAEYARQEKEKQRPDATRSGKGLMAFLVLIIGGTGQVGAAVVRALTAEPSCAEVVMVNRKPISLSVCPGTY